MARGPADVVHARSVLGNSAVTAALGGREAAPSVWAGQMMLEGQNLVGNQAVLNGTTTTPILPGTPGSGTPPGAPAVPTIPAEPKKPEPKKGELRPGPKAAPPPSPTPEAKDKTEPAERPDKEAKRTSAGPARSPAADPKFQALKKDVNSKKRAVASSHPPPAREAGAAQAASVPPADDQEARGKAAHAEDMDAAEPKAFDKQAFIDAVKKAIADRAPKNLEEADEFGESGKAEEVKGEVQGKVGEGKDASAKDIAETTAETPQPAPDKKEVVPMAADKIPGKPGTPNPNQATPDTLPPEATDMSAGPAQVNDQMASAQVTEQQLSFENSREPQFGKAVQNKKDMEAHSAEAPGQLRKGEAKELKQVKTTAATQSASAMAAIHGARVTTGKQVGAGKEGAKSQDEEKRAQVTALLQDVFDKTKCDVEKILSNLDKAVDRQFTDGEKLARNRFTREHEDGMRRYKAKRYSAWNGDYLWLKDKLLDLPDEANRIYEAARDHYLAAMEQVIKDIAATVERELNRAKDRISTGRKDLQQAVDKLPKDLRALGREAASDFEGKFDELQDTVNDKGTELVDTLATKYTDAVKSVDAEIAKEKEKNKGLVTKAAEAIGGVIETIKELGRMLMNILRKAATAIGLILKDPIGFLDRLIEGVGGGLKLFGKNAGKHLQQGVLAWLLGSGATAGMQLPTTFDILGILVMIAALLGISWPGIRAKLTRRVPDKAVVAAETAIPLVAVTKTDGVRGMWPDLKGQVGDLKKTLIDDLVSYLLPTIILAGITWIISLFNPASAFIRACKMIIDIVRFIVTNARLIIDFVNAVLDAIIAIARGGGGAPALIEKALARSIPVLIGALAALLGIGGIAGKVKQIFQKIARPVKRAVDAVVKKITALIKKLWAKIKPKPKKPAKPKEPKKTGDPSGKAPATGRPSPASTPKKPKDKDEPRKPRRPRPPTRPKRPRRPTKPARTKDRKRKDPRSRKDKRRALAAALREANELIGSGSATVSSVRQGLPGIKLRHRLSSIRLVRAGELHYIELAINPKDKSKKAVLNFSFVNTGKVWAKKVHGYWWPIILSKAKFGSPPKQVWQESVLHGTEAEALAYAGKQSVTEFRKKHPRAADDKEDAIDYLFKKGSGTRRTFLEKLGGADGALPTLKTTGKTAAAADAKTVDTIEEMEYSSRHVPYGRWDPFPSRDADADAELRAAVNGSPHGFRGFLEAMVRSRKVVTVVDGKTVTVTWDRFVHLWDSDTPSREFVKNRFRDLDDGKHEWIPTDYLLEVVKQAIDHHDNHGVEKGLDWLRLQHALRSPTNAVIWRIVDTAGVLSPGAHVGTFYTPERKSTLTNGTKDFHDDLRDLFEQNKSGTAKEYLDVLLGILDSDAKATATGCRLIWSGTTKGIPPHVLTQPVGALFRVQTNVFEDLEVRDLAVRQKAAFDAVVDDFRNAKAALKG